MPTWIGWTSSELAQVLKGLQTRSSLIHSASVILLSRPYVVFSYIIYILTFFSFDRIVIIERRLCCVLAVVEVLQSPLADSHCDIAEAGLDAISVIAQVGGAWGGRGSSQTQLDQLAACEGACAAYSMLILSPA